MWWCEENGEALWSKLIILPQLKYCENTPMEHRSIQELKFSFPQLIAFQTPFSPVTACNSFFLKVELLQRRTGKC